MPKGNPRSPAVNATSYGLKRTHKPQQNRLLTLRNEPPRLGTATTSDAVYREGADSFSSDI